MQNTLAGARSTSAHPSLYIQQGRQGMSLLTSGKRQWSCMCSHYHKHASLGGYSFFLSNSSYQKVTNRSLVSDKESREDGVNISPSEGRKIDHAHVHKRKSASQGISSDEEFRRQLDRFRTSRGLFSKRKYKQELKQLLQPLQQSRKVRAHVYSYTSIESMYLSIYTHIYIKPDYLHIHLLFLFLFIYIYIYMLVFTYMSAEGAVRSCSAYLEDSHRGLCGGR